MQPPTNNDASALDPNDGGFPAPPAFGTVLAPDGTIVPPPSAPPDPQPRARWWVAVAIVVAAGVGGVASWFAIGWSSPARESVAAAATAPNETSTVPSAPAVVSGDAGEVVAACPDGMKKVAAGQLFLGTDSDDPALKSARPAHKVSVDAFCIDATEVTVAAYRECSDKGECKRAYRDAEWPQGTTDDESWAQSKAAHSALCNEGLEGRDEHPANCISWHQADAYCSWRGGSLPTEAQWEFAARGSDGRVYSWGDEAPDSERMNGCGSECTAWREKVGLSATPRLYDADDGAVGTAPVKSFPAGQTRDGLFDMAGNVFEWTSSTFEPYDEVERLAADPEQPARRVIRGGAFNSFMPSFADPALRFGQVADAHTHGIGFRCAAPVASETGAK